MLGVLLLTACNTGLPVAPTATPPQINTPAPTPMQPTPSAVSQALPTDTTLPTLPMDTTQPTDTEVPATTELSTSQPTAPESLATNTPAVQATAGVTAQATGVVTGTAGPQPTSIAVSPQVQQEIADIEKDEIQVRGLQPKGNVAETFINSSQMHDNLVKDLNTSYSPAQAKSDANELWLLRLINNRSLDLYQLQIDLLSEQVLGYYDPKAKDLFVLSNNGGDLSPLSRETLAHEFTHAMQDQHYDLNKLLPDNSKDDDRSIAVRSLVEGDATLAGLEYAKGFFTQAQIQQFLNESNASSSSVLDNAPAYIRDSLLFPYDSGSSFVQALMQNGGYSAVNKALADPPVSSEQVMHPDKYLSTPRDQPVQVPLPPLTSTLGAGWTMGAYGTTGEFDAKEMLQANGASDPAGGADGWGGGSYAFYQNGDNVLVYEKTTWDSTAELKQFQQQLTGTFANDKKSGNFYVQDTRYFSITTSGKDLTYIASNDQAALQKVAK